MSSGQFNIVQSWGVASARHTSATLVYGSHDNPSKDTEYLLDVPLGPSIVRWDVRSGERVWQFQAHKDVVTSMRKSHDLRWVATSCYSGEVKLWSEEWGCVDVVTAPMGCQHHLAWSHDSKRFIVIGNGTNSSVVMYDLVSSTNEGGSPVTKLQLAWQVKAGHTDPPQSHLHTGPPTQLQTNTDPPPHSQTHKDSPQSSDTPTPQTAIDYQYVDAYYMGEVLPSGRVLVVEERPCRHTLMQLLSPDGERIKMATIESEKSGEKRVETLFMSEYKDGCYGIGVQGGRVLIVREDLHISAAFHVGVTARTCVWDGECLVLPTDSGSLLWWSMNGVKVKEVKIGSPDFLVRLDWSVSRQSLWVCGFSALRLLAVKRDEQGGMADVTTSHVISSHEISCCGVAFSPSGRSVAAGDLAGNVWVTMETEVKTAFKFNVNGSVRCVVWRCEDVILVGGLDGQVSQCKVGGVCKPLLQLEGSIIHMRFNSKRTMLALGTSKGMLEVYSCLSEGLKVIARVLAHPPRKGPQDKRFGQLTKQAEVWSLCWSPTDDRVATCSEDQTTKIWETSDWKSLTTLTGHNLAVTSVDWKDVGRGTLIATCSDDRTVRLTDGGSYQLLRVLNTMDIYGWHTLTYLTFCPVKHSPLLLCTTQHGHVVVWDSLTAQRLARGKMHLGSIEGLAWCEAGGASETGGGSEAGGASEAGGGSEAGGASEAGGGRVATVGADCVVNLFTVNS